MYFFTGILRYRGATVFGPSVFFGLSEGLPANLHQRDVGSKTKKCACKTGPINRDIIGIQNLMERVGFNGIQWEIWWIDSSSWQCLNLVEINSINR